MASAASASNGNMNGDSSKIECLKQLLPANDGIDADALHRAFVEQLRQVQAYPQSPSGDVDISGVFTVIWTKGGVPELQATAHMNAWNGSKHWTVKPEVQVLWRSEELKVSCKTAFLAVVRVATAGDGASLAERLIWLSDEGATVLITGIGNASSLLVTIEPFNGRSQDLFKAYFLVRSMTTAERVTLITEKQRTYDGMMEVLSEKIASVDVVDDIQELKSKLVGLENAATDLQRKTDHMQMDVDNARNEHHHLGSLVEMNVETLNELRGELGAAAFDATNIKLTVRNCELALEDARGRLEELVAENGLLSATARTCTSSNSVPLLNATKLLWAASRY